MWWLDQNTGYSWWRMLQYYNVQIWFLMCFLCLVRDLNVGNRLLSHFLFNFTWCWAWSREVLINHEILSQCKVIQHGTPFFLQWESARNKINDSSEHSSSANNNAWWWSLGLVLQGVKIIIIRAHINKVTIMTLTDNDDTDDGQVTIHKKWSSGHDASHSTVLTPPQYCDDSVAKYCLHSIIIITPTQSFKPIKILLMIY